jgi:hypothetical protein
MSDVITHEAVNQRLPLTGAKLSSIQPMPCSRPFARAG